MGYKTKKPLPGISQKRLYGQNENRLIFSFPQPQRAFEERSHRGDIQSVMSIKYQFPTSLREVDYNSSNNNPPASSMR